MIAQAINFAIVFFVIWRFAIRPIKKLMDERTATIDKGLADAKVQAEILARTETEYQAMLTQARKESQEIAAKDKKEREIEHAKETEKTRAEVARMIEEGRKQIELDKNKMMTEIKSEVADLVIASTEKVLGKAVTPHLDKEIVKETIKELK